MTDPTTPLFADLGLAEPVLTALKRIGYEEPTPIQAQSIPPLLAGRDLLGTAQTGTGKTAAFALPLLSMLDAKTTGPQVLVLAPTRELAIQVAEAFQTYASAIKGFHVLPIYGGQAMDVQLRQLRRGAQVVVGTPGRVMDHLRRGTLKLDHLKSVVLDEADEMLRMGFIDDVKWILEHTPEQRQVALFSATMPAVIRKVADTYLRDPVQIKIESRTSTVERIEQKYCVVAGHEKLDALTRILEVEEYDGIIVFVRTKTSSMELADRLAARGHSAAPINGDMTQRLREATISKLKNGKLDILVATDVAARGIDVTRISHVINYDIPSDTEAYVHRIGRTGRAGRDGVAILFVAPRERRLLGAIEKATRQKMALLELPSAEQINRKRVDQFKAGITEALGREDLAFFERLVDEYLVESGADSRKVAAALAWLVQKDTPLIVAEKLERPARGRSEERWQPQPAAPQSAAPQSAAPQPAAPTGAASGTAPAASARGSSEVPPVGTVRQAAAKPAGRSRGPADEVLMEGYRLAVGKNHQAKPGDIVGAIANEAGLDSKFIGRIRLFDDHSTVELPADMPKEIFQLLKKVRVRNVALALERIDGTGEARPPAKKTGTIKRNKPDAAKG
ncbi:MAG TPA: DEAD/DEAH box helicase [Pseudomonadales bacterium]|nr:DEAD/DEAH box helicase [Pseudomonadales bacterium]